MANPTSELADRALRLDFDRRVMVRFRGSSITSDAGLLANRELDGALRLTAMADDDLGNARTGRNGQHAWAGLLRQSVFGRLAGYEDVNDADRLSRDPAMRWIVGERAAASASEMGRFERGERRTLITAEQQLAVAKLVDDAFSARQDRGDGRSGPPITTDLANQTEIAVPSGDYQPTYEWMRPGFKSVTPLDLNNHA